MLGLVGLCLSLALSFGRGDFTVLQDGGPGRYSLRRATKAKLAWGVNSMIGFDDFWKIWPRKDGKDDARKAWKQVGKIGYNAEEIVAGTKAYVILWKERGTDRCHIPMPATYLRGKRWLDESIVGRFEIPQLPLLASQATPTSWNGSARKLIDVIGEPHFRAWFSDALFEEGPPARITPANSFKTNWIVNHYATKLNRLWPDIVVEVRQ